MLIFYPQEKIRGGEGRLNQKLPHRKGALKSLFVPNTSEETKGWPAVLILQKTKKDASKAGTAG